MHKNNKIVYQNRTNLTKVVPILQNSYLSYQNRTYLTKIVPKIVPQIVPKNKNHAHKLSLTPAIRIIASLGGRQP